MLCSERLSAFLRRIVELLPCQLSMRITPRSEAPSSCSPTPIAPGAPQPRSCGALSLTRIPFKSGPTSTFEPWKFQDLWFDSHRVHLLSFIFLHEENVCGVFFILGKQTKKVVLELSRACNLTLLSAACSPRVLLLLLALFAAFVGTGLYVQNRTFRKGIHGVRTRVFYHTSTRSSVAANAAVRTTNTFILGPKWTSCKGTR